MGVCHTMSMVNRAAGRSSNKNVRIDTSITVTKQIVKTENVKTVEKEKRQVEYTYFLIGELMYKNKQYRKLYSYLQPTAEQVRLASLTDKGELPSVDIHTINKVSGCITSPIYGNI